MSDCVGECTTLRDMKMGRGWTWGNSELGHFEMNTGQPSGDVQEAAVYLGSEMIRPRGAGENTDANHQDTDGA